MVQLATLHIPLVTLWLIMSCNCWQIISFCGVIINLWGHIISFWGHIISFLGHIISFWGWYLYWGQGSIGGKIIILWGDFELGARLLTYGGILLTFGGVINNKVNRCLARYSPRATTTNRPTNRARNEPARPGPKWTNKPILGKIWSFLGKKSQFLLEKSKVLLPT